MSQPQHPLDYPNGVARQAQAAQPTRAIGDPNEVEFQRQQYVEGRDKAKLERALASARKGYSLGAGEGALIVSYFEEQIEKLEDALGEASAR